MARLSRRVWASMRRTPGPAAEHLAGQPADGGRAQAGAPVVLGDAQVPARVPGRAEVVDPQHSGHPAGPLEPPGPGAGPVQIPAGDQLGRLGGSELGFHVKRPAVLAQEPGQGVAVGGGHLPEGWLGMAEW